MPTINELRKKIEKTDAALIKKLSERQKLSQQIGKLKAKYGKKVTDLNREKKLMDLYECLSDKYDLRVSFVKRLFKIIIVNSKSLQK